MVEGPYRATAIAVALMRLMLRLQITNPDHPYQEWLINPFKDYNKNVDNLYKKFIQN